MDIKVGQVWKNKVGDTFEIIGVSKESFAWKMDDGEIGCTPLKFWSAIQEPILVSENPVTSAPDDWREAVQEFVDRCEKGEIKSRYTYEKFKAFLDCAPSHSQQSSDKNKLLEIGYLALCLDVFDDEEAKIRQKIFDIVKEQCGITDKELFSLPEKYIDRCPSHESDQQNKNTEGK